MLPAVFEPAIPASKRSQTDALDRAASRIDFSYLNPVIIYSELFS
jgi:hypothetical protein